MTGLVLKCHKAFAFDLILLVYKYFFMFLGSTQSLRFNLVSKVQLSVYGSTQSTINYLCFLFLIFMNDKTCEKIPSWSKYEHFDKTLILVSLEPGGN